MKPMLIMLCPLVLAACAALRPATCSSASGAASAWMVDQGWHTEIGVRSADITGPLAAYRRLLPGAAVLMFGFGKRTWMTAKVESLGELLIGPFPGPGAIQVLGLRTSPPEAYQGRDVVRLALSPAQARRLDDFIWNALGKTSDGKPRLLSAEHGGLFYAARHGYALDYTCNEWTARALHAAGLPVAPGGIVLAGGVMDQAARLPEACLAASR